MQLYTILQDWEDGIQEDSNGLACKACTSKLKN